MLFTIHPTTIPIITHHSNIVNNKIKKHKFHKQKQYVISETNDIITQTNNKVNKKIKEIEKEIRPLKKKRKEPKEKNK